MTDFTPISGLVGGALIGLAAMLLLWFNGRVAGISGIFGNAMEMPSGDTAWRVAFIGGLLLGPLLHWALVGAPPAVAPQVGLLPTIVAGLLVGFGTRLGNGCTSGHGICGLARFSRRSVAATATFFAVALATAYVLRHIWVVS